MDISSKHHGGRSCNPSLCDIFMLYSAVNLILLFGVLWGLITYDLFISEPVSIFPQFRIEHVSVLLNNLSDSSYVATKWDIGISVTNPSATTDLKFDKMNILVRYNDGNNPEMVIPPFRLDREKTTLVNSTVLALWQEGYLPPVAMMNFGAKLGVSVELVGHRKFYFHKLHARGNALCKNMTIGFSSSKEGSMLGGPISCLEEQHDFLVN